MSENMRHPVTRLPSSKMRGWGGMQRCCTTTDWLQRGNGRRKERRLMAEATVAHPSGHPSVANLQALLNLMLLPKLGSLMSISNTLLTCQNKFTLAHHVCKDLTITGSLPMAQGGSTAATVCNTLQVGKCLLLMSWTWTHKGRRIQVAEQPNLSGQLCWRSMALCCRQKSACCHLCCVL